MGSVAGSNDGMGFRSRDESVINCSSGMSTNPFFASGWDNVVSLGQHENLEGSTILSQGEFTNSSYSALVENQGISSNTHLFSYPSDPSLVELAGSGNFSDIVGSYCLTGSGQIPSTKCPPAYDINKEGRRIANNKQSCDGLQQLEAAAFGASSNEKRRKQVLESNSRFDPKKNGEGELQKDPSKENSSVPNEQDDKKPKDELNTGPYTRGKEEIKQSKDDSNSAEAPKDNYIHVRARRGQATNSHSLAERVRREKISERMKLLQDLVPGCNKITGKAVMLDEIINYVQSLQQQVEFLSMKLATVNPELKIDVERILSKDMLHPRNGNSSFMGFSPVMNCNPYCHGVFQPSIPVVPDTNQQLPSMPLAALDNELQSLFQMGFDSSSAIYGLGANGTERSRHKSDSYHMYCICLIFTCIVIFCRTFEPGGLASGKKKVEAKNSKRILLL
ncbi:hypothetical protein K2173_028480 [Erythroxylum novogranatense]|uniref:BHLH domain-containing protein n=1 Tax=Erythroxylum novogranatense TaxID=1862640 RepID=A0AAV8U4S5_9ROSI|nr:hypothetical protein K2173_028480 [Erythroxylum novogranatense]